MSSMRTEIEGVDCIGKPQVVCIEATQVLHYVLASVLVDLSTSISQSNLVGGNSNRGCTMSDVDP